jgi:metal-responsive CopG/Arc/MetJ family transcriptional regulator
MQTAFVKTSVSMPSDLLDWLKERAAAEGRMPVSRIIAQAVKEKMDRQKSSNRRASK